MNLSLLKDGVYDRVMNAVAAGTTNQNGTGVSMEGFETVIFVASFGALTATAVTGLKAQQSDDDGSSDAYDDLASTAIAIPDTGSNKVLVLEIVRPRKKFVRCVVTRGTANAVIDSVTAVRFKARVGPTTQSSTVSTSKTVVEPAEGTA